MENCLTRLALGLVLLSGCSQPPNPFLNTPFQDIAVSPAQKAEIGALVEQLVFAEGEARNQPVFNPDMQVRNAKGEVVDTTPSGPGETRDPEVYQKRFHQCQAAFKKLSDLQVTAFPVLIEHLQDKRQSINFRNHYLGNSVGDACYWILYFQLLDRPENYSEYGEGRTGRDGLVHTKPYWEGSPFDEAGGPKEWLEANKHLTYRQMQIQWLQWLLDKEKAIGACDAKSYFLNILPLEIRILERKQQAGEKVEPELTRLRQVLATRDTTSIPAELLPSK